jgi:alcohol dehydrogenase class IV
VSVPVSRLQWDDAVRRLEGSRSETARYRQLHDLVDAVLDELRRRVGQTYTLAELAVAYAGAEDWVRDIVAERTTPKSPVGVRDTAMVGDAAFARYARGATDYRP